MTRPLFLASLLFASTAMAHDYYEPPVYDNHRAKSTFMYELKIGGGVAQTGGRAASVPFIGVGGRFDIRDSAVEVVIGWAQSKSNSGHNMKYYSTPKITYLTFYHPTSRKSFYYGGGLSWSGVKYEFDNNDEPTTSFYGVFGEAVVGYELNHTDAIRTVLEFNLSQPMFPSSYTGRHPGPTVILSLNFAF